VLDAEIFGLTTPLLTTSDGKKMGKSADGRDLAQRRDAVALRVLAVLAQHHRCRCGPVPQALHRVAGRGMRPARRARRVGDQRGQDRAGQRGDHALPRGAAADAAEATAREVFEKGGAGEDLPTLLLSAAEVGDGISVAQLITRSGLAKSGKEAKRLIADGGARLNDVAITDAGQMLGRADMAEPIKLSAGKKRHALVVLEP
jgi:tyrosyl-tRNA synthetase